MKSQVLNTLHGEHIQGEILRNVLKSWVILQKKFSLITLTQEHSLVKIEIKVAIQFETWLQFWYDPQSLGKPSYYITVISEG